METLGREVKFFFRQVRTFEEPDQSLAVVHSLVQNSAVTVPPSQGVVYTFS